MAQGEQLALNIVIVLEAVVSPGRIEYPVSNVDHVQQHTKFFVGQIDLHRCSSMLEMRF